MQLQRVKIFLSIILNAQGNKMNNFKISTSYAEIINSMNENDMINGYYCESNLLCEFLNEAGASTSNSFIAEFLQDNAAKMPLSDIEAILENPDNLIIDAASVFFGAMQQVYKEYADALYFFKNCKKEFSSGNNKFYLYATPISNNLANYYLLRADNDNEALETLLYKFENDFIAEEAEYDDDVYHNDNGMPVNIDNLVIIATFEFCK